MHGTSGYSIAALGPLATETRSGRSNCCLALEIFQMYAARPFQGRDRRGAESPALHRKENRCR